MRSTECFTPTSAARVCPLVKGCRYRYPSQFINRSKYFSIKLVDDVVMVTSFRSDGNGKGLTPLPEEVRCLLGALILWSRVPEGHGRFRAALRASDGYLQAPQDIGLAGIGPGGEVPSATI